MQLTKRRQKQEVQPTAKPASISIRSAQRERSEETSVILVHPMKDASQPPALWRGPQTRFAIL